IEESRCRKPQLPRYVQPRLYVRAVLEIPKFLSHNLQSRTSHPKFIFVQKGRNNLSRWHYDRALSQSDIKRISQSLWYVFYRGRCSHDVLARSKIRHDG